MPGDGFDFSKFDGKFDREQDSVAHSARTVVGQITEEQAAKLAQQTIDQLETMRGDLARAYNSVPGNTVMEHEIGETLTQVRKSLKRTREALAKLSQATLPLN